MMLRYFAVAAMTLSLAGAAISTPTRADFLKKGPVKSRPAAATRTVTLDLTGMD